MPAPILSLLLLISAAFGLWALSVKFTDLSIADIAWGPGFVLVAVVSAIAGPPMTGRDWLVMALVTLWGIRLAAHLYLRRRRLGHEDHRHKALRESAGASFSERSLVTVFWLQAGLVWLVSWPVQAEMGGPPVPFGILDGLGLVLFAIGFAFEAIGDFQLARFRADPANAGRVLDRGVWAWSRHPNYFGDATLWWGLFLICLAGSGAWWSVLSPLAVTFLLLRVSGVTMMEDRIVERRPAYAEYARRTSVFVPMPPKARMR